MSFWITIAKQLTGRRATESKKRLIEDGFFFIKELGVWIGEFGGESEGYWKDLGGFVWDPGYVREQVNDNFDGALNESISGEARDELLSMIRIALPT